MRLIWQNLNHKCLFYVCSHIISSNLLLQLYIQMFVQYILSSCSGISCTSSSEDAPKHSELCCVLSSSSACLDLKHHHTITRKHTRQGKPHFHKGSRQDKVNSYYSSGCRINLNIKDRHYYSVVQLFWEGKTSSTLLREQSVTFY